MHSMGFADWFLLIVLIIAIIVCILYFLNKKAYKKMNEQNEMIEQNKMLQTAYIIDKKRDRITNIESMPKAVLSQMPKWGKFIKMYFVRVKIGPQIVTLMADKSVYNALPVKKTVKIEMAGMYIVNMIGMKSASELKAIEKAKKQKAKEEKAAAKKAKKEKK